MTYQQRMNNRYESFQGVALSLAELPESQLLQCQPYLRSVAVGRHAKAWAPCSFPWGNCNPRDCSGAYCYWYCSFNYQYHGSYACWFTNGVECCDCICGDGTYLWQCGCQA